MSNAQTKRPSARAHQMVAAIGVAGLLTVGVGVSPALADPAGQSYVLDCADGSSFTVTKNNGGLFSPGFDTASTTVLIPVAYGPSTATLYDAQGNVVIPTGPADEAAAKPGQRRGQDEMMCTFSTAFAFVDPDLGPLHWVVEGTVAVKVKAP